MTKDKYLIPFIIMAVISLIIALGYLYYKINAEIQGKKDSFKNNINNSYWYSATERDSIKKLLIGAWMNAIYNDVLIKTQSPYAALEASNGTPIFDIEAIKGNDNSLHFTGQDGFHMVFDYDIELARNDSMQFSSIIIPSNEKDVLYYSNYPDSIRPSRYVRCDSFYTYVNNIVIAGKYQNLEHKSNVIIFYPDGRVEGLEHFPDITYTNNGQNVYYDLVLDSMGSKYDRILFGVSNNEGRTACYIYERDGQFLYIYKSYSSDTGETDLKGKLLYSLKRIGDAP